MKKCPFCAEQIQDEAVKCRYCGEFLTPQKPVPAVNQPVKLPFLLFSMLCLGPLAVCLLPVLWKKTLFTKSAKIAISVGVVVFSVSLVVLLWWAVGSAVRYYRQIFSFLG